MSINYQEVEELKQAALARDAFDEALYYQLEQVLRELNSLGYKLHLLTKDKRPAKDAWNVQS